MQFNELPRWFKSAPAQQSFTEDQIDAENGILRGVIMASVGPAKGHGVHLQQEFIDDLIAYDQKHYADSGVKARFGHPAFSDTTMGKQMGIFKNYRVEGENAVADLHLLDSANLSPSNPGMKDWMLSMAAERPDFVMSSIVFRAGGYYQYDNDGNQKPVWYYKEEEDEDGDTVRRWVRADRNKEVYVKFGEKGEHFYTDLVEAGAATDSLFSHQFNRDKFAIQAVEFVQDHPELHKFLQENPAKLEEFATKIGIELPKQKLSIPESAKRLKEWLFGEGAEVDVEALTATIRTEMEGEYRENEDNLKGQINELTEQLQAAQLQIEELQQINQELNERVPAPTPLEQGEKQKENTQPVHPFTARAIAKFGRNKK